jgi:uracil-DNA glycosylase family 4
MKSLVYDPDCTLCPRLAAFLDQGKREHPEYFCAPVPPFGDPAARLLLVGLAPGFHGANATGRPFTGDYAGILLYETLYEFGLSTAPVSVSRDDDLRLIACRISNSVKCVPPQNKPLPAEIANCNRYLAAELAQVPDGTVLLALGAIAHGAALRALGLKLAAYRFAHGAEHSLPRRLLLVDSYHCSRYNTNTGRLTPEMFRTVVGRAASLAGLAGAPRRLGRS